MAQKSIRISYKEEKAEILGEGTQRTETGAYSNGKYSPPSDPALFVHAQPREATFPLPHYLVSK